MASSGDPAAQAWHHARKLRKHLMLQIEKLKPGVATPETDLAKFEALEDTLQKFRLFCVQTIFLDFNLAITEGTETVLWSAHALVNTEYRSGIARLKKTGNAVETRNIERIYLNFLRVTQQFYKGYVQRLTARYTIPELKRVAAGIGLETISTKDTVQTEADSESLSKRILGSCHDTLMHLGDLGRYRVQIRQQRSAYDGAVLYYSLATDLIPESGFGHHQTGIINLDEHRHLDIIYHFYRAYLVKLPHPKALSNLRAEFKTLNSAKMQARSASSDGQDVLQMWIARLHARISEGFIFPEHSELEDEVVHRLELAFKDQISDDTLSKITFTNMSAYFFATHNDAKLTQQSADQFSQYALRLALQVLMTVCKALITELKVTDQAPQIASQQVPVAASPPKPLLGTILPSFRLYVIWLASYREEVLQGADAAGVSISSLIELLAEVFTLLCNESYRQDNLSTSDYLLEEDVKLRGFLPLSADIVPRACRTFHMDDGCMKPFLQPGETRLSPRSETSSRILDSLRCAYFLTEDSAFPLDLHVRNGEIEFESSVNGKEKGPEQATNFLVLDTTRNGRGPSDQHNHLQQHASLVNVQTAIPGQDFIDGNPPYLRDERAIEPTDGNAEHAAQTVLGMLTPFLKPPTPEYTPSSPPARESSRGMYAGSAHETVGVSQAGVSPGQTPSSGKFEPLPWAWVYTPAALPSASSSNRPSLESSPQQIRMSGTRIQEPAMSRSQQRSLDLGPIGTSSHTGSQNHDLMHVNSPLDSFGISHSQRISPRELDHSFPAANQYAAKPGSLWDVPQLALHQYRASSESVPALSYPNSFYNSKPAYNLPTWAHFPESTSAAASPQASAVPDEPPSSKRYYQIQSAASRYDAAVFGAAFDKLP